MYLFPKIVEHYNSLSVSTLQSEILCFAIFVIALGKQIMLFRVTLKEEKAAGKKLSEVAATVINIETAEEEAY